MGARSSARQAALQMLFAAEASGEPASVVIADFWRELPGDADDRKYADLAVTGVLDKLAELDELITRASANWRLERMTRISRNVLRLGTWELLEQPEIPRAVVLDESVDLAKRFGTKDAGAFVNGVLDRVADECKRVDGDR